MAEQEKNPEFTLAAAKIPVELDTFVLDAQLDAIEERLDRIRRGVGGAAAGRLEMEPEGRFNLKEDDLVPVGEPAAGRTEPSVTIQRVEIPPQALSALNDSANIERVADAAEAILDLLERREE